MLQRLLDAVIWLMSPVGLMWFLTMLLPASVAALVAVFSPYGNWRHARGPNQSGESNAVDTSERGMRGH
jgi:hypothetical protein